MPLPADRHFSSGRGIQEINPTRSSVDKGEGRGGIAVEHEVDEGRVCDMIVRDVVWIRGVGMGDRGGGRGRGKSRGIA